MTVLVGLAAHQPNVGRGICRHRAVPPAITAPEQDGLSRGVHAHCRLPQGCKRLIARPCSAPEKPRPPKTSVGNPMSRIAVRLAPEIAGLAERLRLESIAGPFLRRPAISQSTGAEATYRRRSRTRVVGTRSRSLLAASALLLGLLALVYGGIVNRLR